MKVISKRSMILAASLLALASIPAQANTITPSLIAFPDGTSVIYGATQTSGELHPGDGFTIFDVGGYTGVISAPANWHSGAWLTGSPYGASLLDDPTLANVHFIWIGPVIENTGATAYFPFVVGTNTAAFTVDTWRSRDHGLGLPGTVGDGATGPEIPGTIVVPFGPAGPGAVPDGGSTAALLGSVLVAFGMLRRRFS